MYQNQTYKNIFLPAFDVSQEDSAAVGVAGVVGVILLGTAIAVLAAVGVAVELGVVDVLGVADALGVLPAPAPALDGILLAAGLAVFTPLF